ncbi:AraC family transcriptional regulator [Leucobacter massiliensis]|uniref:AraC family transcriptional regulator n=1 Tax=Leucobacter massiliensis TaxID=1686285 RepID=A0A2S9QKM4_9MICO|nr:AraC family transcriptional regulator [Leucobacter massiliensis]PRI10136.1 AraC family transcriptional regulator [Leucobacter massiliensis]
MSELFSADAIPPIPPSRLVSARNATEPALLWVRTGSARVRVAAQDYPLSAGQSIWMPAGVSFAVHSDAASLVFPIFPALGSRTPSLTRPQRLDLPAEWSDWLIYQFARSVGYLRGASSDTSLLDLIAGPHPALPRSLTLGHPVGLPPMPSSPEAAAIARALLQNPCNPADTAEHARSVGLSPRTVQQRFVDETGLPLIRWRTAVRVAAAAELMDAGHDIGWAGRQLGFSTPAGFTRAFRARTGMTPSEYQRRRSAQSHPGDARAADFGERIEPQLRQAGERHAPPPPIPATQSWSRINDFHVLVWVYRGSARVTAGGRTRRLRRGDVIWLPAGLRNRIALSPGSLLLPLGSRRGTPPIRLPDDLVHAFPEEAEDYLLHTLLANYSLLRPEVHDPNRITRLFLDRISQRHAETGTVSEEAAPVHQLIRAVRSNPAEGRTLAHWARELDLETNALSRDFLSVTGQRFPAWRSGVRMTEARHCLESGMGVAQTARRLGYAHPSAFTTVFTRAHGMSPRDYQRHGWQHATESLIVR